MSKATGCKIMISYWAQLKPMHPLLLWQIEEDRDYYPCMRKSKRRTSDGKLFLEFHPVPKTTCDVCRFARRPEDDEAIH